MFIFMFKNYQGKTLNEFYMEKTITKKQFEISFETFFSTISINSFYEIVIYNTTKNNIKTHNLVIRDLNVKNIIDNLWESLTSEKFKDLKNIKNIFNFNDLVGWELINIFPIEKNNNIFMTFKKDNVLKQFYVKQLNGNSFITYYYFEEDEVVYRKTAPSDSREACFNNFYHNKPIFDISQKLKGIVENVEKCVITTNKGKIGCCAYYYGDEITMVECDTIIDCPLNQGIIVELIGESVSSADYKAWNETKYYCVDVLSGKIPSDHYKNENKFSLQFKVVDKRTNIEIFSMFSLEKYDYKDLYSEEIKMQRILNPIIEQMNIKQDFTILDTLIHPTIKEFIEKTHHL